MITKIGATDNELNCLNGNFVCGVVEGFYGRPWTTEQRKTLFKRMNKMGMNTYLYAPKDDAKHRVGWRELYSVEEADHLTALVEAAEMSNISFVYAVSPGLDITYSSAKEVQCLKRKLKQVESFGCKSFALLFDDIEVDMCEADKQIFQSFAQAQVSVTNEVYEHLNQPTFLFCPTEYCASRAVPSVSQSDYLGTIGSRLLPGIDIMWTGPKVISKRITISSIEELTQVLKRPPVIWDNIHANDYDPKRLFLGPYNGRSPELIPYLRGVMTNPNCEFESNFIAMHTLAQWSRSNLGGMKKDSPHDNPSPIMADIRLETDGEYTSDEDIPAPNAAYLPRNALLSAILDWTDELYTEAKALNFKEAWTAPTVATIVPTVPTCSTVTVTTTTSQVMQPAVELSIAEEACNKNLNTLGVDPSGGSYMQPQMAPSTVNSLLDSHLCSDSESEPSSPMPIPESNHHNSGVSVEPMDCSVTPGSSPPASSSCHLDADNSFSPNNICDTQINVPVDNINLCSDACTCSSSNSTVLENMQDMCTTCHHSGAALAKLEALSQLSNFDSDSLPDMSSRLSQEDLSMLVDLFYLPFEHGSRAVSLLMDFHWLKTNTHHVHEAQLKNASEDQKRLCSQWHEKQSEFATKIQDLFTLFDKVMKLPNQVFVQEVLTYLWDIKVVLHQVLTFSQWLGMVVRPVNCIDEHYF